MGKASEISGLFHGIAPLRGNSAEYRIYSGLIRQREFSTSNPNKGTNESIDLEYRNQPDVCGPSKVKAQTKARTKKKPTTKAARTTTTGTTTAKMAAIPA